MKKWRKLRFLLPAIYLFGVGLLFVLQLTPLNRNQTSLFPVGVLSAGPISWILIYVMILSTTHAEHILNLFGTYKYLLIDNEVIRVALIFLINAGTFFVIGYIGDKFFMTARNTFKKDRKRSWKFWKWRIIFPTVYFLIFFLLFLLQFTPFYKSILIGGTPLLFLFLRFTLNPIYPIFNALGIKMYGLLYAFLLGFAVWFVIGYILEKALEVGRAVRKKKSSKE